MENPTPLPPDYMNAVGVLNRREIEARLLLPLIEAFSSELGREKVISIIQDIIRNIAYQQGIQLAKSIEVNDLEHFAAVQEGWKKDDAILTEVLEQTERKFSFNVYRCRYAELYEHLGIRQFGNMLSCDRDFALIEGYNPKIQLTRTQTIMEGADICDFCFELKDGK